MSARQLAGRRKKYLDGLPKDATVPKFLRPVEIEKAKQLAKALPGISWDSILNRVVFSSFVDMGSVVGHDSLQSISG